MTVQRLVLIVEDNAFIKLQIASFLEEEGYATRSAANGTEALDVMSKKVAVAIVDVHMEPMGGFEFVNALRAYGYETPVIIITGDQTPDIQQKADEMGIKNLMIKPVKKDQLVFEVRRLIAESDSKA